MLKTLENIEFSIITRRLFDIIPRCNKSVVVRPIKYKGNFKTDQFRKL